MAESMTAASHCLWPPTRCRHSLAVDQHRPWQTWMDDNAETFVHHCNVVWGQESSRKPKASSNCLLPLRANYFRLGWWSTDRPLPCTRNEMLFEAERSTHLARFFAQHHWLRITVRLSVISARHEEDDDRKGGRHSPVHRTLGPKPRLLRIHILWLWGRSWSLGGLVVEYHTGSTQSDSSAMTSLISGIRDTLSYQYCNRPTRYHWPHPRPFEPKSKWGRISRSTKFSRSKN